MLIDRDGVITEPVPDPRTGTHESPLHPEDTALVDGAAAALRDLLAAGVTISVVSNQPAAAKGTVPMSELEAVHERVLKLLREEGVELDAWEYCFHHPDGVLPELSGPCPCRKPAPGLLLRALSRSGIPPEQAWMVGDASTDIAAGRAAGVRTALIAHPLTGHRRGAAPGLTADAVEPDLRTEKLRDFVKVALEPLRVT